MYGVIVTALGGPEGLQVAELPDPVARPDQVVVRVQAVCVQPADIGARTGMIPGGPVPPPFLLGWDIAGEVASVGSDVSEFRLGDRVVGMIPWYLTRGTPGGYAQFVAADAGWLVPLPDGLDVVPAATVPLNAVTTHQALSLPALAEPSTVLVTGASGGVGGIATQLATQLGHRVLAVASHDDEAWVGGPDPMPAGSSASPRCGQRSVATTSTPSARRGHCVSWPATSPAIRCAAPSRHSAR